MEAVNFVRGEEAGLAEPLDLKEEHVGGVRRSGKAVTAQWRW